MHPTTLPLNELKQGRKPMEKLPVLTFDDFDAVELAPPPKRWEEAPGMPYDPGLDNVRHAPKIDMTPERQRALKEAQMRGDKVKVAQLMKQWSNEDV